MLLETSNGVVMGNIIVARSLRQLSGMLDSQVRLNKPDKYVRFLR